MTTTWMPRSVLLMLVILLLHLSLARSLSLGQLTHSSGSDDGDNMGMGVNAVVPGSVKRDGRRITRGRYRMGYMFGKRSESADSTATLLIRSLIGKAMPVGDLGTALHTDPALAERVARHLDKNGDGYVAVGELL